MKKTKEEIKNIIMDAVVGAVDYELNLDMINDDTRLLQDLSFDSYDFIKLTVRIENELNITYSIDDLDIDRIEVLSQLVDRTYQLYLNS